MVDLIQTTKMAHYFALELQGLEFIRERITLSQLPMYDSDLALKDALTQGTSVAALCGLTGVNESDPSLDPCVV